MAYLKLLFKLIKIDKVHFEHLNYSRSLANTVNITQSHLLGTKVNKAVVYYYELINRMPILLHTKQTYMRNLILIFVALFGITYASNAQSEVEKIDLMGKVYTVT